jgi:ketosteroid isomerase-like protein
MRDRALIARLRDEWLAAFNRQDVDRLDALVTSDLVQLPPNRPALVGLVAARRLWTQGFEVADSQLRFVSRELEVAGDWAFDWFDWMVTITALKDGVRSSDSGKSLWIWRREADTWKVARSMWNSDNANASFWAGGWVT